MNKAVFVAGLAVLALTAGCEARFGNDGEAAANGADASAEGKSEEGKVSFKAPGIDIKVNIPEGVRDETHSEGDIIYPGSKMSGIHIEGALSGRGAVELRFTTSDAPEQVAGWYRSADRTFTLSSQARQGAGYLFEGKEKDDGSPFKLRLSPSGGGTEGVLSLTDRN